MVWRPFYFANLIVDPKDENKVFKVDLILLLSVNGGKSFSARPTRRTAIFTTCGSIARRSQSHLRPATMAACGAARMAARAGSTSINLPVSQFYHVSVDKADPYRVYGGLQDNSSWVGDSSFPGGISNSRWENMYGGDGFWMWEDPADPTYIYCRNCRAARSAASTATRTKPAPSSLTRNTARRSCASTGTRPSRSAPMKRAPSTSARSSCSARAITASRGIASRPT